MDKSKLDQLANQILQSRKYCVLDIPPETVIDLLQREIDNGLDEKTASKNARKKLHNIIAPYLGDPEYSQVITLLEAAYRSGDLDTVKKSCSQILKRHASTCERLPILEDFYFKLFQISGKPSSIIDLACGLNPLTLPWMDLPLNIKYYAYDIHTPRVKFINLFFELAGIQPLGEVRDVLVNPPTIRADVAFFFKEAHRLEQRHKGANREVWQALDVGYLFVSLPTRNLNGLHNLTQRMQRLVENTTQGLPWSVRNIEFSNELVFCIMK